MPRGGSFQGRRGDNLPNTQYRLGCTLDAIQAAMRTHPLRVSVEPAPIRKPSEQGYAPSGPLSPVPWASDAIVSDLRPGTRTRTVVSPAHLSQ